MKKNIIIAIIAILIIWAIVHFTQKKNDTADMANGNNQQVSGENNTSTGNSSVPTESEKTISSKVLEFGKNIKLVSTQAGDYKNQVQLQYGMYVAPDLLAKWKADPKLALAKDVSDPLPDRIEIANMTKVNDQKYVVDGSLIEVGVASPKPVGYYPVMITVENERGVWLITGVTKGAFVKAV
jgi:hypothetical protein